MIRWEADKYESSGSNRFPKGKAPIEAAKCKKESDRYVRTGFQTMESNKTIIGIIFKKIVKFQKGCDIIAA